MLKALDHIVFLVIALTISIADIILYWALTIAVILGLMWLAGLDVLAWLRFAHATITGTT